MDPSPASADVSCEHCLLVDKAPLRPDVPVNLQRLGPFDDEPKRFRYVCLACGALWVWVAPEGWRRIPRGPANSGNEPGGTI